MNLGFAYSPLTEEDGIRILLLQPAISRDVYLRGSLQHISLAQQYDDLIESYTALSYVWGDPTPVDKILIDDQELGITANLSAALRDLRDSRRTHTLWADAVCIDQGNIPERSKQVARMGEIYGSASNTIIYLGPPNPYLDAIIELARHHVHLNESEIDAINPGVLCKDGVSTGGDTISLVDAAHQSLLPNPWFRRIWVLQELVLSRVPWVQCGLKRVRWLDLCRLLVPRLEMHRRDGEIQNYVTKKNQDEENKENYGITALETMDNIRAEYHESSNSEEPIKRTLWQVLQSRKGCQVSDPRDIIFAHMGIISDRHEAEELIRIDYSQAVSEVFVAMGRYVRYHDGFRAKLDNRSTPSPLRTMFSLPSWVPEWGVEIDRRHLCSEDKTEVLALPQRLAHVFPLTIWGGAKIIALSGILPPPSSLEYMKISPIHKYKILWNDIVDKLPATTKDSTLDAFGLHSWPREAARLSSVEYNDVEVLDFQEKMTLYLRKYVLLHAGMARLALLNSGMMILVPCEALLGDIVVVPVREWSQGASALTVRPCESRDPTDLSDALRYVGEYDNFDPKDCWFLHASLIGVCAFAQGVAKSRGFAKASHREMLEGWHVPGLQDDRPPPRSRVLVLY
ncbi:heterokaryon incompatibility protein-domain-containing protein [Xylaria castorea]|nr:heterokaryon incompatibility protein-domain-containing protein [Xylaria castorea]